MSMYTHIKKVSKYYDVVCNHMRLTRVWKPVENEILTRSKNTSSPSHKSCTLFRI